jgi:O-acetylhomoserine/O-acetylserine sulfhydrylase-like pyridoxal-dependent enzyme
MRSTDWKRETQIVYSEPCPFTGSHVQPIYQTSTFVFDHVDQGADRFAGREGGYIYSRLGNPTVTLLEEKMALMEEGEAATIYGSGMAAISAAVLAFVSQGDHVVAQQCILRLHPQPALPCYQEMGRFGHLCGRCLGSGKLPGCHAAQYQNCLH